MTSDIAGNYSLPAVYLAVPGQTIQAEQHNAPLQDLAQGMTDRLMRDGRAPMIGNLNMNGFRISNLLAGTALTDAVTLNQLNTGLAPKAPIDSPSFTGFPKAEAWFADRNGYPTYEWVDRLSTGLRRRWASYVDSPTGALVFLDRGTDGQGTAQPWLAIYPDGRVRLKQLSQAGNPDGDLVDWVTSQIAAATAPKNIGDVGSYALCRTVILRSPGSTYAGSELEYAGFYFEDSSAGTSLRLASGRRRGTNAAPQPLNGTWRIMAFIGETGSADQTAIALFQRIA